MVGRWKGAGGVHVPRLSLEQAGAALDEGSRERFLGFVREMLRWVPEERKTASEFLRDPWMAREMPLEE